MPSTGRTSKAKLFAGNPEPRRIAATAGGSEPAAASVGSTLAAVATCVFAAPREPFESDDAGTSTKARQIAAARMRRSECRARRASAAPPAGLGTEAVGACGESVMSKGQGNRCARSASHAPLMRAASGRRRDLHAQLHRGAGRRRGLGEAAGGDAARAQVVVDAGCALNTKGGDAARVGRGGDEVQLGGRRAP